METQCDYMNFLICFNFQLQDSTWLTPICWAAKRFDKLEQPRPPSNWLEELVYTLVYVLKFYFNT